MTKNYPDPFTADGDEMTHRKVKSRLPIEEPIDWEAEEIHEAEVAENLYYGTHENGSGGYGGVSSIFLLIAIGLTALVRVVV